MRGSAERFMCMFVLGILWLFPDVTARSNSGGNAAGIWQKDDAAVLAGGLKNARWNDLFWLVGHQIASTCSWMASIWAQGDSSLRGKNNEERGSLASIGARCGTGTNWADCGWRDIVLFLPALYAALFQRSLLAADERAPGFGILRGSSIDSGITSRSGRLGIHCGISLLLIQLIARRFFFGAALGNGCAACRWIRAVIFFEPLWTTFRLGDETHPRLVTRALWESWRCSRW